MELAMIETSSSIETSKLLKSQVFYGVYEVMINLAVCSFLAYGWSMAYHCAMPSAEFSCWITLLALASAAFCYQSQLQILFLTGLQARESILALRTGSVVFFVTLLSLYFNILPVYSRATVSEMAVHVNALLAQSSVRAVQIQVDALSRLVEIGLSFFTAFLAVGMVIPAVRFTQNFHQMNFGSPYERAPLRTRILLGIDFILPLYTAVLFSALPDMLNKFKVVSKLSNDSNYQACSADDRECNASVVYDNALFVVQLVIVAMTVVLRVFCMRKHLQCFLDSLVKVVSMQIFSQNDSRAQLNMLHAKIKVSGFILSTRFSR